MTPRASTPSRATATSFLLLVFVLFSAGAPAQDRLKGMPGYDQFQKMSKPLQGAVKSGAINATWSEDGRSFDYTRDGKRFRFDVARGQVVETGAADPASADDRGAGRQPAGAVERGRQATLAASPDKTVEAVYRDRNLYVRSADGSGEVAVTTDGSEKARIKYGTASWVYGEELDQTTAMWWSPDSRKLAYYRFDESPVPDYHLQLDQTKLYSKVDSEAYPKAGQPNPIVDLFVYDVATRTSTRIDVRDGRPFDADVVGHYVYRVAWSPDGRQLLFNRTNRRQQVLELVAADPQTGACRVVIREEWPTGWIENSPAMVFLADGKRFIWESERSGWRNFYLYDLDGRLLNPVTSYSGFEAVGLVKVDEARGLVFVTARDGDNHMKVQLHRVGIDGRGDRRLTEASFHHTVGSCLPRQTGRPAGPGQAGAQACGISPDGKYVVDVYQTHDIAPATRLIDAATGRTVTEIAASDLATFGALGLKKAEMFTYLAADGKTRLHGLVSFPSTFDPAKRYPALVAVYGGPASASNTARETFVAPNPLTEYGFLVVNLDTRSTPGMGKRQLDSIYLKLGQVEVDDMAEGVKALWSRPWFDKDRVGIYGTSYGGYSTLMAVLRHPGVFRVGSSSSPVTAWDHYDSVYTERYMWTPGGNQEGYRAGSAMTYASQLDGRLLLYYGTADNNVHPTNMMQLIQALQKAGKSFEVQVGPDAGHSGVNQQRMMEFFIENLVVSPVRPAASSVSQ